jgi:DNA-binding winged helix-turn-helix (wHTH) protein/tetratricopeptide (TPR) repeat protein
MKVLSFSSAAEDRLNFSEETMTEANPVFEFAGFRLDRAVLQFGESLVPLPPKAIDTLYVLVSRAPQMVSKDELMRAVWPDTFVVDSGLARNISLIRKALEDHSKGVPFIETIPKRGYRFVAPVTIVAPVRTVSSTPPTCSPEISEDENPALSEAIEDLQPLQEPVPEPAPHVTATPSTSAPSVERFPRDLRMAAIGALCVLPFVAWWQWDSVTAPAPDPQTAIGYHLLLKVNPTEARQALASFEQAVEQRPNSATAHAGVALTLVQMSLLGVGGSEILPRARLAAETAVRLNPNYGDAHAALGATKLYAEWDFKGAEADLRRALELDSRSVSALVHGSRLLSATGRLDEALIFAQRAAKIDPVSPIIGVQLGMCHYAQQRYTEAEREFRSVLHRERNFGLAHYYLGLTLGQLGRFDEATTHLRKSELNSRVLQVDEAWLALRRGDPIPAEQAYQQIQGEIRKGDAKPAAALLLAASLGKLDEAFRAVDAALAERSPELLGFHAEPRLSNLATDARFQKLASRLQTY